MFGNWPLYVVERLKLFQGETGMWTRWTRRIDTMVNSRISKELVADEFMPPNMDGNILVVFVIFIFGMTLGFGVFIVERTNVMLDLFKNFRLMNVF